MRSVIALGLRLRLSIATKDERRTVFSLDTFSDKTFNIATACLS